MTDALLFERLEVHGVKHYGQHAVICSDEDADHFSIYGMLPNGRGCVCVGDFSTRDGAELVVELLGY